MSKINDYYLMRDEKALEHMREVQEAMTDAQDTYQPENDRWWKPENNDKKFVKHCDSLLNDKPF